jgi:hypothetical protein
MLRNLNDEIEECRRYAEDCRRRAQAATDPVLRAELSDIEERWLYLARSYEFTERVALTLSRWRDEGGQSHSSSVRFPSFKGC